MPAVGPSEDIEAVKSNPIAIVPEATNEQEGGENHEIEANHVPHEEAAIADLSPGIAIPGLCAAETT